MKLIGNGLWVMLFPFYPQWLPVFLRSPTPGRPTTTKAVTIDGALLIEVDAGPVDLVISDRLCTIQQETCLLVPILSPVQMCIHWQMYTSILYILYIYIHIIYIYYIYIHIYYIHIYYIHIYYIYYMYILYIIVYIPIVLSFRFLPYLGNISVGQVQRRAEESTLQRWDLVVKMMDFTKKNGGFNHQKTGSEPRKMGMDLPSGYVKHSYWKWP